MGKIVEEFGERITQGDTAQAGGHTPGVAPRPTDGMKHVANLEWDAWILTAAITDTDGSLAVAQLKTSTHHYNVWRLTAPEAKALAGALELTGDDKWESIITILAHVWKRAADYTIKDLPGSR